MIYCPHCKKPIYDPDALLCHFCGESLDRPSRGVLGRMKYTPYKAFIIFIVFFIILCFIMILII